MSTGFEIEDCVMTDPKDLKFSFKPSPAGKAALEGVNRHLITSKPYNIDCFSKVRNIVFVMNHNRFSIVQGFLMILTIASLAYYGIIRYLDARNSTNSEYKPLKVDRVYDYQNNPKLIYTIPAHYILIMGEPESFERMRKFHYFDELNDVVDFVLNGYFISYCGGQDEQGDLFDLSGEYSKNITFSFSTNNISDVLLLKIEFGDFDPQHNTQFWKQSAWFSCYILWPGKWEEFFEPNSIWFFVSTMDLDAETVVNWETFHPANFKYTALVYIKEWKSEMGMFVDYYYEESTVDGVSKLDGAYNWVPLNITFIHTVANPTVVHHVSYTKYSYTDWVADLGGFLSLAVFLFFTLSAKVTNYANRNDLFNRRQGILPVISRTYRNAEELAGVRYLLVSALGISGEEYFAVGR